MDLNFHGTAEQLEYYALGRLADSEVPALEEHLMVCAACRDQLDRFEAFALGMRQALSESAPESALSRLSAWFTGAFRKPAFGLALAGTAAAAILLSFVAGRPNLIPVASVQLMAIRGDMPFVQEAREVQLNLADAPAGGPYRVELVDAMGKTLWHASASAAAGGLLVKVARHLAPGDYFVRLYSPASQVVHEYGFRVR